MLFRSNATGYSLLDNYYLGAMKEVGQTISGANFDFENNGGNLSKCTSNGSITCVVFEPKYSGAINYPAHGVGYLRVAGNTEQLITPVAIPIVLVEIIILII